MSKLFSISSEIVCSPVIFLFSQKVSMSFKNNEKRKGNRFSPCLTPFAQSKYSDIQLCLLFLIIPDNRSVYMYFDIVQNINNKRGF